MAAPSELDGPPEPKNADPVDGPDESEPHDADGLTFVRAAEIEQGEGPPPSEAELKEFAKLEAFVAPLEPVFDAAAKAKRIYDASTPAQQRRLWNMDVRQVVRLDTAGKFTAGKLPPLIHVPVRRENTARPRERRRSTSASRRGPPAGDPDSEPPPARDLDGLRGFRAASSRMFAHVGRRLATGGRP
jgi:hypothetical protein